MVTLGILATGLLIVIGGILGFRLHAFVALVLAGLAVAILTPASLVIRSTQLEGTVRKAEIDLANSLVLTATPIANWSDAALLADVNAGETLKKAGRLTSERPVTDWKGEVPFASSEEKGPSTIRCYEFELNSDNLPSTSDSLRIVTGKQLAAATALGGQSFMTRLTNALGSYCGSLAILIVAASIIGRCLMDSGAADRIVTSTLNVVGEKNAPAAFVVSGFTLSIPVFFDTVFYLMIPLGKALRLRTGGNYLLYVLAIVAGGTMAHSLVPPTPGPLFIAEAFEVSLASMIVGGCIVGLFSSSVGMLYAIWANRRFVLELPEAADADDQQISKEELDANAAVLSRSDTIQPGLLPSLIPIVLPVLMITAGALVVETKSEIAGNPSLWTLAGITISKSVAGFFAVMGEKTVALLVAAIFAVLMYVKVKRPTREVLAAGMQDAVTSAGTIILVTAAGGAFGRMMRQANVAELLEGLPSTSPIMIIVAAFLVTTAVRTAQGSSTVAMMTAAGIFGGLVTSGAAGVDPLYVALAVGCGSKPISWMNDSGFWVITRMSGMTEKEGLKYITPMTALAGVAGLSAVIVGSILFP